uniref:Uncharacterized protein n=1 Tax=Panagrolaimus sp. ES5 TaxID=591445 RepID=A0AC34FAZ9_9BILA
MLYAEAAALEREVDNVMTSSKEKLVILNYNDQTVLNKEDAGTYAHAKGLIIFLVPENGRIEDGQGFFLQHSCPKLEFGKPFPQNCLKEGQHFLCININIHGLNSLAEYLFISKPHFTTNEIPLMFRENNRFLKNIHEKIFDNGKHHKQINFLSRGGKYITIFTKSVRAMDRQLWDDIIMRRTTFSIVSHYGRGKLKSTNDFVVVDKLKVLRQTWKMGNEHSKYALSNLARLCFSDVNYFASYLILLFVK